LREAVKEADGSYVTKTRGVIISAHGDSYAKSCGMKW